MKWIGALAVVATACGGGAHDAGSAPAVNKHGAASPSGPAATVTVHNHTMVIAIAGSAAIEITADSVLADAQRAVLERLPASPTCPRAANPAARVIYLVGHAVASAVTSDARVTLGPDSPATGLVGAIALLQYPTEIVDRATVVPWQFCPAYSAPKVGTPSMAHLDNGDGTVVVWSEGGLDFPRILSWEASATTDSIAQTLKAVSGGAPIAATQIYVHEGVTVQQLTTELAAVAAVGTGQVEIVLARAHPEKLTAVFDSVKTTGGVSGSVARTTLARFDDALGACYERAAFVDPTLAGRFAVTVVVRPGVALMPSLAASPSPMFDACVTELLGQVTLPRVEAQGMLTLEIVLSRSDPWLMKSSVPPLHGTGDSE